MSETIMLVDGNSLMHRAYHAIQSAMNAEDGTPTNALFGFLSMLLKAFEDERPAYCATAFDMHAPTFRHLEYDEYKAGRPATPDDLIAQFPVIREILADMHVGLLEKEGFEADDLLGTASKLAQRAGLEALILTGDRDAYQLADEHISILYTRQGAQNLLRVTPEYLMSEYALTPEQMIDLKGLMGDASDNIPGVPGVGEKTALKLLAQYGSLERVLETADAEQKGRLRERLMTNREQAVFSKHLATIRLDAPIALDLDHWRVRDMGDALPILQRFQLHKAAQRLSALAKAEKAERAAEPSAETESESSDAFRCEDAARFAEAARGVRGKRVAAHMGTNLSLAVEGGASFYVHMGGDLIDPGVDERQAARLLNPLAEAGCSFVVSDIKTWMRQGALLPRDSFDVMLAAYALASQRKSYSVSVLLSEAGLPFSEDAPARAMLALAEAQRQQIARDGLDRVLYDIELPLAFVLRDMEETGFLIDADALRALDGVFSAKIASLTEDMRAFEPTLNVNSPKQLGVFLFEKLGLKGRKKTATGYSTSADALEPLQDEHPIIPMILEYRKYAKLKSTYVDALLRLRGEDGRVRTSFDQVSTATGRISSLEPNLQNIPVRTPLGRDIRKAFVAPEGWVLVDADYSQIELRVLAAMAEDEHMIEAFRSGKDIHASTASEVYGVPLEEVTGEMRSAAKAVNFGIVYGISDFGLARNIGVTRAEAAAFIERYLTRYPAVKKYMEARVDEGKAQGYVTTLLGRRRYLPELEDGNRVTRQFGERAAMNSPIQGTAADIIKLAMVRVHDALTTRGLRAKLILQVHDELIVEAPMDEADEVCALVKDCMESVLQLSVPMRADVRAGRSWYDCK